MNKYKFTYFLNTACAERRPQTRRDLQEDWIIEEREYPTDLEAFEYMYKKVYNDDEDYLFDLYEDLPDQDDLTKINAIKEDFENVDISDGSTIVISIEGPGQTYDSGYTKEDFNDDYIEDDEDYNDEEYLDENKKLNENKKLKWEYNENEDTKWYSSEVNNYYFNIYELHDEEFCLIIEDSNELPIEQITEEVYDNLEEAKEAAQDYYEELCDELNESNDKKIEILQKVKDIVSNIEGFNFISLDTASVLSFNYKNKYIDIKFFVEDITTNLIDCNIHLPNFGLYNELKQSPKYNELIENTFKNMMRRIDVCNFDKDLSIDNLESFINNLKNNLDEYLKIISNKKDLIKFLNLGKDESKKVNEEKEGQLEIDEKGLPVLEKPYRIEYRNNDDRYQITSSHPYDLTDYSWAISITNDINDEWKVIDRNKQKRWNVAISGPYKGIPAKNWNEALDIMKDIDSKLEAHIDRT